MVRRTQNVFKAMALWMVGFGMLTGLVFPFFVIFMEFPAELALRKLFFLACIIAGAVVGGVNFFLVHIVIGNRLRRLAGSIKFIEGNLLDKIGSGNADDPDIRSSFQTIQSEDEFGEIGAALNRLVESLVISQQNDSTVRVFSEILVSKLELQDLAKESLEQLLQYTRATAGAVLVTSGGDSRIAAAKGIYQPERLIDSKHIRDVMRTEQKKLVEFPEDIAIEGVLAVSHSREVLLEPLIFHGVLLGVLILANSIMFDDEARSRIEMFRPYLALAFHNALTHERLQLNAALDPLTGAYNRRFGMQRLEEEFSRSLRMIYPFGLIMLDIDHFKKVNDSHGHLVGDQVLREVGGRVLANVRKGDVVVRYGGEEILVFMPAATKNIALTAGERIRAAVAETPVVLNSLEIGVTVSAGVSSYPSPDTSDLDEIIKKADDALYVAKNTGRNRVVGSGGAAEDVKSGDFPE